MSYDPSDHITSRNITWTPSSIAEDSRADRHGHRGAVVWFTGLSGSGKTTLAQCVEEELFALGGECYVLDGDNIRHGLNRDLGFSADDRTENIRRVGEVAALFSNAGLICLTAFISPYRDDRRRARAVCPEGMFLEVHCACSLEACEERDPKGLYRKAREGRIDHFTGITAPYQEPEKPELVVDTEKLSPQECVRQIIGAMVNQGIIPPDWVE